MCRVAKINEWWLTPWTPNTCRFVLIMETHEKSGQISLAHNFSLVKNCYLIHIEASQKLYWPESKYQASVVRRCWESDRDLQCSPRAPLVLSVLYKSDVLFSFLWERLDKIGSVYFDNLHNKSGKLVHECASCALCLFLLSLRRRPRWARTCWQKMLALPERHILQSKVSHSDLHEQPLSMAC